MPRLMSKSSPRIQMHNADLFNDLMGDDVAASTSSSPRAAAEPRQRQGDGSREGAGGEEEDDTEEVDEGDDVPRHTRHARSGRHLQKVRLNQKYVPAYARTTPADRATKPHPKTRKLPDAKKEARRRAAKKLSQSQMEGRRQRKLKLAAAQEARDEETARLVKASMVRKKEREEAQVQALLRNVHEGQDFMEEKKKELAVEDRKAAANREEMYNRWNDDVFMPIQNQIFEVVNQVDYKELSRRRMKNMEEFLNITKTRDIFLASDTGAPGHTHQTLKVKKLRDPLKRLLDKRTEEMGILGKVEKRHRQRAEQVAAGIDPNLSAAERRRQHKQKRAEAEAVAAAAGSRRRDKTQRIGVVQWHPKKFEATPEGHFARLMRTRDGTEPPQRRSFVHDPYRTRVSKVIHGDEYGRRGTHIPVESPWQSREAAAMARKRRDHYTATQQQLHLRKQGNGAGARPISAPVGVNPARQARHEAAPKQQQQQQQQQKKRFNVKPMPTRVYTGR